MPQYSRPDGDVTRTNIGGGTYASIDETSASDADFVYGNENAAVTFEVSLSNPTAPSVDTGHTFRYRIAKLNGTSVDVDGATVYCTVSLYQGASLIKADAQRTAAGWTSYDLTLSEGEASGISDYNDLRLRFVSPASGGSAASRRAIGISWAELQLPVAYTLAVDTGAYALTGIAAGLKAARKMTAVTGTYELTGNDVTLTYTPAGGSPYTMIAGTGTFTLTGNAVTLRVGRKMVAASGSYTLTGKDAALKVARKMVAAAGTYVLTGQAAALKVARKMTAAAGTYTLTGISAGLKAGRKLAAAVGAFVLTGNNVHLKGNRKMSAQSGSFALTGISTALRVARKLAAGVGSFVLTGSAVTLTYTETSVVSVRGRVVGSDAALNNTAGADAAVHKVTGGDAKAPYS